MEVWFGRCLYNSPALPYVAFELNVREHAYAPFRTVQNLLFQPLFDQCKRYM